MVFTGVYGPQSDGDKRDFIIELQELRESCHSAWCVAGDFKMVGYPGDRSNQLKWSDEMLVLAVRLIKQL